MPATPALVSVIVPAYNVADIVGRAIRSALTQTHNALEVLVVDDASDDDTRAVATAIAAQDPRVRVLHCQSNGGPGRARNVGLDAARGGWIALLDADDAYRPDRLQRLLEIAARQSLDLLADNLELVDPGLHETVGTAFPLQPHDRVRLTAERFAANSIPGGKVMLGWMKPLVRRQFLVEHGIRWRPLRHAEDFLLVMELLLQGASAELTGWAGYRYTQRRGIYSGSKSPHSRAQRSVADQTRAVEILLAEYGGAMTPRVKSILAARPPEIYATAAVLDMLEALREHRLLDTLRHAAGALSRPAGLTRCLYARYGPKSRRMAA
jgi:succinoglycan biosynthesis protein ExoO